ncbi:unnamed protein product [Bursaphelenchus okinawaensis]|uniref:Moesin/ezrin/radixin homolog 1 n=1 Tax=Bursaphelenchus okinawaensis TaxID=465554 RepID=A0A811LL49_9BILA|nr:unnamed protein product [Bursaphelenchus okinawaensis]CAG9124419.1 unnamed protein product [Bursaphelenchus okinawaensis]
MQKPVASRIPQGVGAVPPPGMDPRKGKLMCIKVRMLDDTVAVFHLGHRANGQALFDEVCRHLNLLESDYFGLEFVDGYGNRCWLDKDKSILRQITAAQSDARFYFVVKFYTPNPSELEEEYTRYLLSLQIRRDLAHGEFVCNENTAALLASFIVQAECGDYSAEDYPDHTYLSVTAFVPHQTSAFQMKVMDNHKKLVGMTPADADLALLETARRCDFYGIKLHQAKDLEGTDIALSVAHMGIKVFQHLNCASTFSWAKIRKLSFKRKKLMIKLHPDPYQFQKETAEFIFDNRNECKNFWKKCVEHHAFFRCLDVQPEVKKESKFFTRGSSFRYQGRTQKQLIDYVREHHKRREPFERLIRPSMTPRAQASIHNVLDATRDSSVPYQPLPSLSTVSSQPNDQIRTFSSVRQQRRLSAQRSIEEQPQATGNRVNQRPKSAHSRPISEYIREERAFSSEYEPKSERADVPKNNSKTNGQNGASGAFGPSTSAEVDPMSVSLPNVLGEDIKVICREFQVRVDKGYPSKSASGDNFLNQSRDNISEGSYRLEENSSQSDVATTYSNATDPRVYSTTFTTKRVGNVIVKKVKPAVKPTRPQVKDSSDDDSSNYSDCRVSSVSAPARHSNRILNMNASQVRAGFARCKDNVAIPIDCPPLKEATPPYNIGSAANPPYKTESIAYKHDGIPSKIESNLYKGVTSASEYTPPVSSEYSPHITGRLVGDSSVLSNRIGQDSTVVYRPPKEATPPATSVGTCVNMYVTSSSTASGTAPVTSTTSTATIIRPVVLSSNSPPTPIRKPIFIKPNKDGPSNIVISKSETPSTSSGTPSISTIVNRPSTFDPNASTSTPVIIGKSENSSFRTVIPTSPTKERKSPTYVSRSKAWDSEGQKATSPVNISGPLPGKIITRQNVVLTPYGVDTKPEKPSVPPKPKDLIEKRKSGEPGKINEKIYAIFDKPGESSKAYEDQHGQGEHLQTLGDHHNVPGGHQGKHHAQGGHHPLVSGSYSISERVSTSFINNDKDTMVLITTDKKSTKKEIVSEEDRLLEPLESILNDANNLAFLSEGREKKEQPFPTLISVESEDRPDLKKLHLLNGEIPYTLTMRNIQQAPSTTHSTFSDDNKEGSPDIKGKPTRRSTDSLRARKSIDLVHRNRLPSLDSFSSQDHSISPTTPEAGNVIDYVSRRRSVSSDRYSNSGATSAPCARRNKNPERRRTQPVQLTKSAAIDSESPTMKTDSNAETSCCDPDSKGHNIDGKADNKPSVSSNNRPAVAPKPVKEAEKQSDSSSSSDLPEPPRILAPPPTTSTLPSVKSDSNTVPQAATHKKETGLIETDL